MRRTDALRARASARAVALCAVALAACATARAALAVAATAPDGPAARCAALAGQRFDAIPDAPTKVDATELVAANGDLPAYCRLQGTIPPQVGIELRLPAERWNGKFFQYGRGGYCRAISMEYCDEPLRKGYACVITDHGHKGNEVDDEWMHGNLQARVDCGFRATHVATVAGKALTERFYSQAPKRSYFMGCSTGGRLGLVEAQRFPWDFDGIVVGGPPVTKAATGMGLMWAVAATLGPDDQPLLDGEDLRLVAAAAVARCDLDDRLADGVISDPRSCRFDPGTLQCPGGRAPGVGGLRSCLRAEQVAALRRVYQGPVNSRGLRLNPGAPLPGSELNWIGNFVPARRGERALVHDAMTAMFRYMNEPDPGPGWQITRFDWNRDYARISMGEAFNGAANPDLRAFKAAGGKLIVFHGYADEAITTDSVIDYVETVQRTLGGPAATADFARLFLVPGMNHCAGGAGATVTDYIDHLENWVERGRAPDRIVVSRLREPPAGGAAAVRFPLRPADVAFARPVFPYPTGVRYDGKGDPASADSFLPAIPGPVVSRELGEASAR